MFPGTSNVVSARTFIISGALEMAAVWRSRSWHEGCGIRAAAAFLEPRARYPQRMELSWTLGFGIRAELAYFTGNLDVVSAKIRRSRSLGRGIPEAGALAGTLDVVSVTRLSRIDASTTIPRPRGSS